MLLSAPKDASHASPATTLAPPTPWQAESGKRAGVGAVQGLRQSGPRLAMAGHVEWRGRVRRVQSPGQDSQKALQQLNALASFFWPSLQRVCLYKCCDAPSPRSRSRSSRQQYAQQPHKFFFILSHTLHSRQGSRTTFNRKASFYTKG